MKFEHYRNKKIYEIVTIAADHDTGIPLVIYRAEDDGKVWSRPATNFFELIEVHACGKVPRFVPIAPDKWGDR